MPRKSTNSNPLSKLEVHGKPVFPYTTRPGGLRKFLSEVPKHPRPTKVNQDLLAAWKLGGNENNSIIRVLKAIDMVNEQNGPTEVYTAFMQPGSGPTAIGSEIRRVYAPLFEAVHSPNQEPNEDLRRLFNIHSGGAAAVIDLQMQTFRALCDNAELNVNPSAVPTSSNPPAVATTNSTPQTQANSSLGTATIHIDLHIHLPQGKTARDYEYIIQDIGKYILGRQTEGGSRMEDRM